MVVNWCVAHKKTDWHTAHKVLFTCFLQLCSTRRWISCSARNRAHVFYTKVTSCVAREFGMSHSTKIQKHTCAATRECQLRCERYHTYIYSYWHYLFTIPYILLKALLRMCTNNTAQGGLGHVKG